MSGGDINELLDIWGESLLEDLNEDLDARPSPFDNKQELYDAIDSIKNGDVPWESFNINFADAAEGETTSWKLTEYPVFFRDPRKVLHNQLSNRDFSKEMDYAPKVVNDKSDTRRYCDFMSGQWAWRQAVRCLVSFFLLPYLFVKQDELAKNPDNHGSTFCPIILGSDKTTVSVATGQNEYYPLYMSNGLVHNNVRRAHRNALTLVAFLAIPKSTHDPKYDCRTF